MDVWIVLIGMRINAVFARESDARRHIDRLHEVNGDQLAVRLLPYDVRPAGYVPLPNG
jgi:hypothetical protein